MKHLYLLLFICFGFSLSAQIVTIPDVNFKNKLLASSSSVSTAQNFSGNNIAIDANGDGEIQNSEAQQVGRLGVSSCNIASVEGINSFTNLRQFHCDNNQLTTLDISGLTLLNNLFARNNNLTSINFGPSKPVWIEVQNNQLTVLNFPSTIRLQKLNYTNNNVTNLNFSSLYAQDLMELYCSNNEITNSLNLSNFVNLQLLYCDYNFINSLNLTGLTQLKTLDCSNNQLTTLNINGHPLLYRLSLGHNPMPLPNLNVLSAPLALKYLAVNSLGLSSLNVSSLINLWSLDCSGNQLTTIDISNLTQCNILFCLNNPLLESIFVKNGIVQSNFNFSNCPNLQYICADENELNSIQSQISNYGYSNCHVNSYCTLGPAGTPYTIQGNFKFDYNFNGCDSGDYNFPNYKLNITNGTSSQVLFSNTYGNYTIPVQSGTHILTPILENPNYFTVTPTTFSVSFPSTSSPFIQNLCLSPNGTHNDLEVTLLPLTVARPGFNATYELVYKNKGTHLQFGTVNLNFNDAVLDFVSANPTTANQSINTLSWNFFNLLPFETRNITLILNLNSPTETPAVNSGDVLNYTARISGLTDETPNDNSATLNQTVVNAIDPNDKTCLQGTTITPSQVGDYVHYMIRFENSGTANAENIVVRDVIDTAKFDITTLRPISSSHSMTTQIKETNKVEFIFQNIQLAFDDANNDGYVAFKIKTKPTLVLGDSFSNSANIYFDYNFPIVTNTATTTVQTLAYTDFEFNDYLILSPNPAKNVLNIQNKQNIQISSLAIYNVLGQVILVVTQPSNLIDVSTLDSGTYFIKVASDKGSASSKFIKE